MLVPEIKALALAAGLTFAGAAQAADTSKAQHEAQEDRIEADYKVAKVGCDALAGNAKDICAAQAKGAMKVAKAEEQARHEPSTTHAYEVRVARAEADYAVASERCDDKAGNAADVCVKEAKAAKVRAIADAKTRRETVKANATASEKSDEAMVKAEATKSEARQAAASAKRDADYAVAKERCDALAGDTKATCVSDAKARFGMQ